MGKARRKSKTTAAAHKSRAPIPLSEARQRAAKQLGIPDLVYAEKRLCEILAQSVYGQDWGALHVDPHVPIADLWTGPWRAGLPVSSWTVEWDASRVSQLRLAPVGIDVAGERGCAYGIWIAPAVIERPEAVSAVVAAPKPKRKRRGPREKHDIPRIKRTMRELTRGHRLPLEGEGGIAEKLRDRLGEDALPERSRLYQIYESIFPPKRSTK